MENVNAASTLRDCILNSKINEPLVFQKIHQNWPPLHFTLETWGRLLEGKRDKTLNVRCGKRDNQNQIQWESDCKKIPLNWKTITEWDKEEEELAFQDVNNTDHWIYYDYKYMTEIFESHYLEKFEWSKLGFADRDGNDSTLWIGTRGAYTPMHFDSYGCNLVSQVVGRKKWILFPPKDTKFLKPTRVPYEESSVYSELNLLSPSSMDFKNLSQCSPLEVTLEPGDVLFVPPKWWHFVKSEEFTISVNTWVELADDVDTRIQEAVIRSIMGFVCNMVSPDSVSALLNPNEVEILDLSEDKVVDLLKTSTFALVKATSLKSLGKQELITLPDLPRNGQELENEPQSKRQKLEMKSEETVSETSTSKFDKLLKTFPCCKKLEAHNFDSHHQVNGSRSKFNAGIDSDDRSHVTTSTSTLIERKEPRYIEHLINAIGHPDVLKHITAQFLLNISQQNPT